MGLVLCLVYLLKAPYAVSFPSSDPYGSVQVSRIVYERPTHDRYTSGYVYASDLRLTADCFNPHAVRVWRTPNAIEKQPSQAQGTGTSKKGGLKRQTQLLTS